MTNHWVDLQNCKTILVEGSNVAENHPMAFKWIRKAQENGATIIHVDPRYTRTSSAADVYARIRPGTDVALQNAPHFIPLEGGNRAVPVNRTDAIGFMGGAQNTNEECYLFQKAARLLGMAYVEHQARL